LTNKTGFSDQEKNSESVMNAIVLPDDTNPLGILRGGTLLHWMDISSVIAAQKYSSSYVVTASVFNASFERPVKLGDIVSVRSKVTRSFNTSLEVYTAAWAENPLKKKKYKAAEAHFTFVALDRKGKPVKIGALVHPQSELEKKEYKDAGYRRKMQLMEKGRSNGIERRAPG
jgi:acyl-CoA hydrolase